MVKGDIRERKWHRETQRIAKWLKSLEIGRSGRTKEINRFLGVITEGKRIKIWLTKKGIVWGIQIISRIISEPEKSITFNQLNWKNS